MPKSMYDVSGIANAAELACQVISVTAPVGDFTVESVQPGMNCGFTEVTDAGTVTTSLEVSDVPPGEFTVSASAHEWGTRSAKTLVTPAV